jgi:hypothetical protein
VSRYVDGCFFKDLSSWQTVFTFLPAFAEQNGKYCSDNNKEAQAALAYQLIIIRRLEEFEPPK